MSTADFSTIFDGLFAGTVTGAGSYEDQKKARSLLNVVSKSTASLGDMVQLADALGFTLTLSVTAKPEPKDEATK
ncbi:hypothetical protein D3C74_296710 [compost metagenome]